VSNTQLQQMITLGERLQKFTKEIKEKNRVKLDKDTMNKYIEEFQALYPEFHNDWGKGMSA
jgi:hypothetical protein